MDSSALKILTEKKFLFYFKFLRTYIHKYSKLFLLVSCTILKVWWFVFFNIKMSKIFRREEDLFIALKMIYTWKTISQVRISWFFLLRLHLAFLYMIHSSIYKCNGKKQQPEKGIVKLNGSKTYVKLLRLYTENSIYTHIVIIQ